MPRTLRLPDGSYMRRFDVQSILHYLRAMQCVEVIGFSNIGKSALLRLLAQSDVWIQELGETGSDILPVYIDCNRMLDMSDQGFYELILRCLQESGSDLATLPALIEAYNALVNPSSEFQVPLSFNRGLTAVVESTQRRLVLLFDEFDEPFTQIAPRVLLNLRAMKDRHGSQLVYVVAVVEPMIEQHAGDVHSSEFRELFNHRAWYLAPLTHSDTERLIQRYMDAYEAPFVPADFDFIYQWAGGHPCLVEGVCRVLEETLDREDDEIGAPETPAERWRLHRHVTRRLRSNETLLYECETIWNTRSDAEQEVLLGLFTGTDDLRADVLEDLYRKHILLKVEGKPRVFCRLLAEYIQRQAAQEQPDSVALWVDMESGAVTVNDEPVETLTNLEYRLMLLLFHNAEKIVTKYQIVSNVWGEDYIDEVDDARIEKLISRLRQKIEPDPANPLFLTTVRGRGYCLSLE